jgi:hypothetical protein
MPIQFKKLGLKSGMLFSGGDRVEDDIKPNRLQ